MSRHSAPRAKDLVPAQEILLIAHGTGMWRSDCTDVDRFHDQE